jgi:uncharacterized membrane protein YeaQ/YmgE (transglycosylase-associated protein family)
MQPGEFLAAILSSPLLCLSWAIAGFVGGAGARRLLGEKDVSFIWDILLGVMGGLLGGVMAALLGFSQPNRPFELTLVNIGLALSGSVILISAYRMIVPRRRKPRK